MWFANTYLKTLRSVRIAIVGWGAGIGLLLYAVLAAVPSLLATPEAKASLTGLAGSFAWLAEPVAITTPGGYATWKYGPTILILALWPLLACSRLLRGEEERGSLDVLLALPCGRARIALEKLAAVWSALLLMGLLIALLDLAGGRTAGADFGPGGALLFALNLVLICGFFGSLAFLLSQFTRERRVASGLAGGLLVIFIVLDMVHRVIPDTDWISRLSPVYYYNLSKPLIPGYGTNLGALLGLLALNVLLSGVAIWLFVRRDVGSTVALPAFLRRPEHAAQPGPALPVHDWSLRSLYARNLRLIAIPTCWWTLGIAGFAAWMVVIARQTESLLATLYKSSPFLKDFLTKVGGSNRTTNATLLSAIFLLLPLLLMAFAVTQASRWSADEEEGRLELVLATPQPRLRVLLGRFAALTTSVVSIGLLTLAATAVASAATGLVLDAGNLAAATLSIIPLGLLMAAIGYLLSGWLHTALDTGLLSFVLLLWFFISFIGPDLNWPDAILRLSAIYYYGTPLLHGLPLLDMLGVLAVGTLALLVASARFVRKDIGR
ncbi:MAG TPA: ABC transporter permease subunit [Ktedonobacteraceae bacterium]|jgi:ABC-2 type transport system permease protein